MGKEILIIVLISFHFSAINDYFSTCIRVFSLPPPHTHTHSHSPGVSSSWRLNTTYLGIVESYMK